MQLVQERDGKHQLPASTVFAEPEIEILEAFVPTLEGNTERQKNPHPARRLARAGWVIARLGRLERLLQTPDTHLFLVALWFRRRIERRRTDQHPT